MKKTMKHTVALAAILVMGLGSNVNAMHLFEGYLEPTWCIMWGVIAIPFFVIGCMRIKEILNGDRKNMVLMAMCGAFIFILSALKIPSVVGSCSHPTGVGLSAVIFGPFVTAVLGTIVLIFQAVLLAHGGLTTLGANSCSMAIAGPILSYVIYKICTKCRVSSRISIFLAAVVGDIFTYCVTSFQLGLAFPVNGSVAAATVNYLGIFAVTQVPIAIAEGILTVLIFDFLIKYSKDQLKELHVAGIVKEKIK